MRKMKRKHIAIFAVGLALSAHGMGAFGNAGLAMLGGAVAP